MSHDTSPEVKARRIAILASLRPEERLLEALRMSDMVAELARAGRRFRLENAQAQKVDGPAGA